MGCPTDYGREKSEDRGGKRKKRGEKRREDSGEGVSYATWAPRQYSKVVLTPFDHFNDLSQIWANLGYRGKLQGSL